MHSVNDIARFESLYVPEPNTGCWLWIGHVDSDGYGQLPFGSERTNPITRKAHRFAYEAFSGEIPKGLTIDHLCRVRCCVNPLHLEAVLPGENTIRGNGFSGINFRKTHCPKGHSLSDAIVRANGRQRMCRECNRERCAKRWNERKDDLNARRRAKYSEARRGKEH